MSIHPRGIFYVGLKPSDAPEIVDQTLKNGEVVDRLLYKDIGTGESKLTEEDVPFYQKQNRLLLAQNGHIDPTSLDDYLAIGGYTALSKALFEMDSDKIIDEVKKSGLRGRGGGGFPTGRKWATCREAHGDVHYIICNGDEGDPGAYMDRSILEGNPHSVIEGMVIGAWAIGGNPVGYVYVRNEYPLAVRNLSKALDDARKAGLLGKNILGSGLDFGIEIRRGGGAFVCGESTALMASLEGKVGEPRAKNIHTVESGLHGKPSNLNNVETWANVPLIIRNGSGWYSKIGTDNSKGTKVFSLVGKINNTGLVEVPMGITLKEIIYDIGGGIRNGKKFKGVQTGGPSGGVLAEQHLDLPVDFESLDEAGSMMGSGGMIVMDEDTCMVDVARYYTNFLAEESCGKCTTCRDGLRRLGEVFERITNGGGKKEDIELIEDLCEVIGGASECALAGTAPNPVLTTLKYFRDEYDAHIFKKKCPAKVCKGLITFKIDKRKCTGCHVCYLNCPSNAIRGKKKEVHEINPDKCIRCGVCYEVCKYDAVNIK